MVFVALSLALGGADLRAAHAEGLISGAEGLPLDPDAAYLPKAETDALILTANAGCHEGFVDLGTVRAGGQAPKSLRFHVEIADTAETRARGLMYRRAMARDHAMLFIYEAPQRADFWMKNTFIPLDIIFADDTGRVVRVHEGARPLDLTPIHGGMQIRYVLEVNAGLARTYGITAGAVLRHPRLGQGAVWPCG